MSEVNTLHWLNTDEDCNLRLMSAVKWHAQAYFCGGHSYPGESFVRDRGEDLLVTCDISEVTYYFQDRPNKS